MVVERSCFHQRSGVQHRMAYITRDHVCVCVWGRWEANAVMAPRATSDWASHLYFHNKPIKYHTRFATASQPHCHHDTRYQRIRQFNRNRARVRCSCMCVHWVYAPKVCICHTIWRAWDMDLPRCWCTAASRHNSPSPFKRMEICSIVCTIQQQRQAALHAHTNIPYQLLRIAYARVFVLSQADTQKDSLFQLVAHEGGVLANDLCSEIHGWMPFFVCFPHIQSFSTQFVPFYMGRLAADKIPVTHTHTHNIYSLARRAYKSIPNLISQKYIQILQLHKRVQYALNIPATRTI